MWTPAGKPEAGYIAARRRIERPDVGRIGLSQVACAHGHMPPLGASAPWTGRASDRAPRRRSQRTSCSSTQRHSRRLLLRPRLRACVRRTPAPLLGARGSPRRHDATPCFRPGRVFVPNPTGDPESAARMCAIARPSSSGPHDANGFGETREGDWGGHGRALHDARERKPRAGLLGAYHGYAGCAIQRPPLRGLQGRDARARCSRRRRAPSKPLCWRGARPAEAMRL